MISGILTRFLTWFASRGLRIMVREIADALEEAEIERDYREALVENERRMAEARTQAGADATRERIANARHEMASDDLDAFRERMRSRDPKTR
jgi:hypothetical protein